jgi:hypothetical protein
MTVLSGSVVGEHTASTSKVEYNTMVPTSHSTTRCDNVEDNDTNHYHCEHVNAYFISVSGSDHALLCKLKQMFESIACAMHQVTDH